MSNCLTLKKSDCQNCYKCIRRCPVKAIRFSENQAYIIGDECILCGQCFSVCPHNAKEIVSEIEKVKTFLQGSDPVIVSLAPSFVANYEGVGINSMRKALKKLGFFDVEETAIGATMVKNEYENMIKEECSDIIISSSCHSVNLLIQKYFPSALRYLAGVVSPMQAHCQDIKKRYLNAKTVFIGPCVAKKDEAEYCRNVTDAVLTFEELTHWLKEANIELIKEKDSSNNSRARIFPTAGGILKTMAKENTGYSYIAVDGVDNCIAALKDIEEGKINKCFIEMTACVGSCTGGPLMDKKHSTPIRDYVAVSSYSGENDFEVSQPDSADLKKNFANMEIKLNQPTEMEIYSVLRQMGKFNPSQELNCGFCGYNTCREKAMAVCQGKAEISMCLPYLKYKAESFSDTIVKNAPNGLIILNEQLEVQQINSVAREIMNIRSSGDVLGESVVRILDPGVFMDVLKTGVNVHNLRVYLAEYKRYVEQTVLYDRESHLIVGILRDRTREEENRERKESISRQTIEVADKVVEKQMRIVQEIASLLGETAAETKIALSKLKESISDE